MKTYYLDYVRDSGRETCYGGTHIEAQRKRKESFSLTDMDEIVQWGYDDSTKEKNIVDTDFYTEVGDWFDNKLHGYYAWKPFIIYDLLSSINDGDVVVYWDCNPMFSEFENSFQPFLNKFEQMPAGLQMQAKHVPWTKKDCFELMKCTDRKYWRGRRQIQATWSIWKKSSKTMDAVSDWLYWCKNENVVRCDLESVTGEESSGFVDHRHDQSVLTNISVKHHCNVVSAKASGWRLRNNGGKNLNWLFKNYERITFIRV